MPMQVREWTLVDEIGRGGMGVVWRARHQILPGDWAVKVIRPEFTQDSQIRTRFLSEVTVLKRLRHPNIIEVDAPFEQDGQLYLPMEYLTGQSLEKMLTARRGPWDQGRVVDIVGQAAAGLGFSHRQNPPVIHRDIKPGNIQVLADGRVKLLDFGLARTLGDLCITLTGNAVGTPEYLAPEVLDGNKASQRSDVYALGVVLYRMLAGRLPYDMPQDHDSSAAALVLAVARAQARGLPDIREFVPGISTDLANLVMRCVATDPALRPQDGAQFAELLGSCDLTGAPMFGARMPPPPPQPAQASQAPWSPPPAPIPSSHSLSPDRTLLGIDPYMAHASKDGGTRPPGSGFGIKFWVIIVWAVVLGVLGAAGWWFGIEQPRRQVIAIEAESARKAVQEKAKLKRIQDEKAQAEAEKANAAARSAGPSGVDWVNIPGGSFQMGAWDGKPNESPVHHVSVSAFEISRTEVTVSQYRKCVNAGVCTVPNFGEQCNWGIGGHEDHPVNCVDWGQASTFASWAGGRLPTEAEWEYAARGAGKDIPYPWGRGGPNCGNAVIAAGGFGCGRGGTWPVCSKSSGNTEQGLCDMGGNVWEMVQDAWHENYDSAPSDGSAWGGGSGLRANRGGSWLSGGNYARVTSRDDRGMRERGNGLGFRVARGANH